MIETGLACGQWRKWSAAGNKKRDLMTHYGITILQFETMCWLYLNSCVSCARTFKHAYDGLQVDHIDGDWQNNDLANLQPLCRSCNHSRRKSKMDFRPDGGRRLDDLDAWVKFYKRVIDKNDAGYKQARLPIPEEIYNQTISGLNGAHKQARLSLKDL